MHEFAVAKKVVEEVKKQAKKRRRQAKEVAGVEIEVGELSGITPGELKRAMHSFERWKLVVKQWKARVECVCGFTGKPKIAMRDHEFVVWKCPQCGALFPRALEGKEVVIKKIVVNR